MARLLWRQHLNAAQTAEVEAILREACRADEETLTRIAQELRGQQSAPHLQAEIDGVVARYKAAHPERRR